MAALSTTLPRPGREFRNGTGKYFGGLDIDGFEKCLPTVQPYSPLPLDRITKQLP